MARALRSELSKLGGELRQPIHSSPGLSRIPLRFVLRPMSIRPRLLASFGVQIRQVAGYPQAPLFGQAARVAVSGMS